MMTDPEDSNQPKTSPDLLKGLSDEEVFKLVQAESGTIDPGDVSEQAAKARRGLDLLRKAKEEARGIGDQLKNFLGAELAGKTIRGSEKDRLKKYYNKGTLIANGRYRLESPIGEGGMGTVWVAEQREPVRRRVALKLIKPGMDSGQVLQRFEAERQALAAMDHPNIARVFDGGLTDREHPFFVMELVNGANLTTFCDEAKLSIRERLEIFCQIAQAIQHAHHKGILHRDLKPSNILVTMIDGKPVPKIIDFGLAKVLGSQQESAATGFGMVVGTVEYMAPEQAGYSGQDVDTRADIYSLGVILYELLTGLRPFDSQRLASAAIDEVLRIIKNEEPLRPSLRLSSSVSADSNSKIRRTEPAKLSGLLRKELDWVVMKSLEKDRNRRYDSAKILAEDVQRYLSGEPVSAHPPLFSYRLRKFVGKHKLKVLMTSVMLLASILGVAGIILGLVKAKESERVALEETAAKETALVEMREAQRKHEESRIQALRALRSMTNEFLSEEIAREADLSLKDKTYLRNIIKQFDAFSVSASEDVEGRTIRADARIRVGRIYSFLGDPGTAENHLRESLNLWKQLHEEIPAEDEYRRRIAACQQSLGSVLMELGQNSEAEELMLKSMSFWKQRSQENPSRYNRLSYSTSLIDVAGFCYRQLRYKEAEKLYLEAISIREAYVARAAETRQRLASAMSGLAAVYDQMGQTGKAREFRDVALQLRRRNVRRNPYRSDFKVGLARSLIGVGSNATSRCDWSEAEQAFREAQQIFQEMAVQFPSITEYRMRLADCCTGLASCYIEQDRKAATLVSLAKEIELREALLIELLERSESKTNIASLQFTIGRAYSRLKQHRQAESNWLDAIRTREQLLEEFPDDHSNAMELARVYQSLAAMQNEFGQDDEALANVETALRLRREVVEAQPDHTGWRRQLVANLQAKARIVCFTDQVTEAKLLADEALNILRELIKEYPEDEQLEVGFVDGLMDLVMIEIQLRNFESAENWLNQANAINQQALVEFPNSEQIRNNRTRYLFFLILLRGGQLKPKQALETAAELRDLGWNPPKNAYFAACGLARCVPILKGHAALNKSEQEQKSEEYANQAIQFLRRAVRLGYNDKQIFERDYDLNSLRERTDFKQLMKELEQAEGQ